jgi:hypothetical protein
MQPTTPPQTDDRKLIAKTRLAARARRITMLRRRVAAGALTTFALPWGVVSFSGSLGTTTPVTAAANVTAAAATTADHTTSVATGSTTSSSAPLTTSQS